MCVLALVKTEHSFLTPSPLRIAAGSLAVHVAHGSFLHAGAWNFCRTERQMSTCTSRPPPQSRGQAPHMRFHVTNGCINPAQEAWPHSCTISSETRSTNPRYGFCVIDASLPAEGYEHEAEGGEQAGLSGPQRPPVGVEVW